MSSNLRCDLSCPANCSGPCKYHPEAARTPERADQPGYPPEFVEALKYDQALKEHGLTGDEQPDDCTIDDELMTRLIDAMMDNLVIFKDGSTTKNVSAVKAVIDLWESSKKRESGGDSDAS